MTTRCCRTIFGLVERVGSPFARLIATGYYDGPTEGVVECGDCKRLYHFEMVDCDDNQDVRIFTLAPIQNHTFEALDTMDDSQVIPNWPTWVLISQIPNTLSELVDGLCAAATPVEFVVATEQLLGEMLLWRPIGGGYIKDWFDELKLTRRDSR